VTWRRLAIDGFERLIGKGIYYGAARSEASAAHGLDVYLIGGGNSAGQAALHFARHARSVTLVVRGDSLAKGMSRYLIDQLAEQDNVKVELNSEIVAARGDTHLTSIDIRSGSGNVESRDCGGLFVFIGADAETDWLPGTIARDSRGYVLTGDDVVKAGRWSGDRDPYLLESSIPGVFASATSGGARSSASRPPWARAAWRSHSSTSICSAAQRSAATSFRTTCRRDALARGFACGGFR